MNPNAQSPVRVASSTHCKTSATSSGRWVEGVHLETREDVCGAADEIVQASPAATKSWQGRLPTVVHTLDMPLRYVGRGSGHDTSPMRGRGLAAPKPDRHETTCSCARKQ